MGVTFSKISVGSSWDRKELAVLWGYASFHAFGKGVFTPRDDNKIVLFVKEEKRAEDEQYEDRLVGKTLHWHGPKGHGPDRRIAFAHLNGDEIHVFYRASHGEDFLYLGKAKTVHHEFLTTEPSRFELELLEWPVAESRETSLPNPVEKRSAFDYAPLVLSETSASSMPRKPLPRLWSREEVMIAMNLYCKLPFGQLDERNPVIIELAALMDRSAGSVAMKLCNLASLDPVHQARGVKGLSGVSQIDREVWSEFHQDWSRLSFESELLLARLQKKNIEDLADLSEDDIQREGLDREQLVKQRVNQHFFRRAVLAAYNSSCCITGLQMSELLVASHLVPWAKDKANRVNPRNGLCLNAYHDRAFDRGLITLNQDLRIEVSPKVKAAGASHAKFWLTDFEGAPIRLPNRFAPAPEFIDWHRRNVFQCSA